MPVLVKDLEIAHDPWTLIEWADDCDGSAGDGRIFPFDYWCLGDHTGHIRLRRQVSG